MTRVALAALFLAAALGVAVGVGAYTFVYARGASYLTNDPAACANCHVMQDYYSAWLASSHRSVSVCNDRHTPPGLVPKYATKASNGFWHSFAFTTGDFPDPLRIKPHKTGKSLSGAVASAIPTSSMPWTDRTRSPPCRAYAVTARSAIPAEDCSWKTLLLAGAGLA